MKVGDEIYFVPDRAPVRDAKTLTVEYVGDKHFMATPYTFRIIEGGAFWVAIPQAQRGRLRTPTTVIRSPG